MSEQLWQCQGTLWVCCSAVMCCEAFRKLARWLSTALAVQVFHDIAYKAKDRHDLIAGIDEFLDEVIVLPPGEWDPTILFEPT